MKSLFDFILSYGGGASFIGGMSGIIFGSELNKTAEVAQKSLSCTMLHDCPPQPPEVWAFAALGALLGALVGVGLNRAKRSK